MKIQSRRAARQQGLARWHERSGQSLVEFTLVLPILLVVVLGVTELGYGLLDQHIATKLTREGSNLISRDVSLQQAEAAMRSMSTRPVNFTTNSRMIFSVIKNVATVGAANYNTAVLYERHEFGALAATSKLTTLGAGSFGPPPDYVAPNSDNNTNLQVTNLPPNVMTMGGMLYVTEIYTSHTLITPFHRFGIQVPNVLYSIAYF